MNKSLLGLISILLAFPAAAAPVFVLPSGTVACSVDVTGTPRMSGSQIKHVEITSNGHLLRDIITRADGSSTEVWRVLDDHLLLASIGSAESKSVDIFLTNASSARGITPRILALDPASLSWITPGSLVGTESKNGKETLHYHTAVLVPGFLPHDPPRQVFYDAWIDAKTLAPLAFNDGDVLYELTFTAPPTDPLVMPEQLQKSLQYYQNADAIGRRL